MSVHIELDGGYRLCQDHACPLPYHLPLESVEEAEAIPSHVLQQTLEVFDPPVHGYVSLKGKVKTWYDSRGRIHRDYGLPAQVGEQGSTQWRQHGKLHRGGDLPAVIDQGYREWWQKGKRHREGAPAVIYPSGLEVWYRHGRRHRLAGPAYDCTRCDSGASYYFWWAREVPTSIALPASYLFRLLKLD